MFDRRNPGRSATAQAARYPWTNRTIERGVSVSSVLVNWAGLVALWALPYLTLLDHLRVDAAHSEILQWSLLIVGVLGFFSILYTA